MSDPTTTDADTSAVDARPWGTTAFAPGDDVGLVARHTVGLIAKDNPSTRERLWGLVSDDAPIDDILDELSSTGLKALPDFALAQVEGDSVRIVARGAAIVTAETSSGEDRVIDASGVRTWIEELLSDVEAVTISLGDAPGTADEAFAVLAGSVPATSLTRRYDAPDDHAAAAESGAGWVASGTDADASNEPTDEPEPTPESDPESDPDSASGSTAPGAATGRFAQDVSSDDEATILPPQPEPAEGEADDSAFGVADATSGDDDSFDDVGDDQPAFFDAEPPVTDADHDESGSDDDEMSDDSMSDDSSRSDDLEPVDLEPVDFGTVDDGTVDDGTVDDDAPRSSSPPPPTPADAMPGPAGPPPTEASVSDASVTVAPGDVARSSSSVFDLGSDGDPSASPAGETDQVDEQESAVGVLAFSNGIRQEIDRTILIGRNPKIDGTVDGPMPHIMKFDGLGQGLSRTHAEIRVENGSVVVEDLQSTNGTDVVLPGRQRQRLRGGEPVAIPIGTLIDFGEELHCTLDAPD